MSVEPTWWAVNARNFRGLQTELDCRFLTIVESIVKERDIVQSISS